MAEQEAGQERLFGPDWVELGEFADEELLKFPDIQVVLNIAKMRKRALQRNNYQRLKGLFQRMVDSPLCDVMPSTDTDTIDGVKMFLDTDWTKSGTIGTIFVEKGDGGTYRVTEQYRHVNAPADRPLRVANFADMYVLNPWCFQRHTSLYPAPGEWQLQEGADTGLTDGEHATFEAVAASFQPDSIHNMVAFRSVLESMTKRLDSSV